MRPRGDIIQVGAENLARLYARLESHGRLMICRDRHDRGIQDLDHASLRILSYLKLELGRLSKLRLRPSSPRVETVYQIVDIELNHVAL